MLSDSAKRLRCRPVVRLIAFAVVVVCLAPLARAQEANSGAETNRLAPLFPSNGAAGDGVAALGRVPILQPITGSMMVSPPYGTAPLKVGFFVLASDPEDIGFLTYSWNFGDGTVSSLPPELYIFHTYANPGTYVCSLVIKTVDGRSKSFFQGVIVKDPTG
jgi:PKD domain